jgi:hypothetical protein
MEKAAHPMNPVHPAEAGKVALRMIQVHQAAAQEAPEVQETVTEVEAAMTGAGQDSAQETEHSPHRRTEQASAQQNKHSHRV